MPLRCFRFRVRAWRGGGALGWRRLALVLGPAAFMLGCSGSDGGGGGGGDGSEPGGASDEYAASRQACVERINGFRATLGIAPLAHLNAQELWAIQNFH